MLIAEEIVVCLLRSTCCSSTRTCTRTLYFNDGNLNDCVFQFVKLRYYDDYSVYYY